MSAKVPEFVLNENLRFVPKDPVNLRNYVEDLKKSLVGVNEFQKRASLLGEIGFYLRSLDQFDEAEKHLLEALHIISLKNLGIAKEIQQKIRLAHVWQEKKDFNKSEKLFAEIIQVCRENTEAQTYLDFALQHAGKNFFDKGQYQVALEYFSEALSVRLKKNSPFDQIESSRAAIKKTQELMLALDQQTLKAYSGKASEYSLDWLNQPEPSDMYKLLQKFFLPNEETVDIGSGNGRDANWLQVQGFKVNGYDSSMDLIKLASNLYPQIQFKQAYLPFLKEIQKQFSNVLCETVIMHLPQDQIPEAVRNLKRILRKGGILYLSWRVTEGDDFRHTDGRLYSAFEPQFITKQFAPNGVLHFEDKISESSGKRVCRLIFRKDEI